MASRRAFRVRGGRPDRGQLKLFQSGCFSHRMRIDAAGGQPGWLWLLRAASGNQHRLLEGGSVAQPGLFPDVLPLMSRQGRAKGQGEGDRGQPEGKWPKGKRVWLHLRQGQGRPVRAKSVRAETQRSKKAQRRRNGETRTQSNIAMARRQRSVPGLRIAGIKGSRLARTGHFAGRAGLKWPLSHKCHAIPIKPVMSPP